MTALILSLVAVSLFIIDAESRGQGVLLCRASGRLQPALVLSYRGTGRLGCYRASERG